MTADDINRNEIYIVSVSGKYARVKIDDVFPGTRDKPEPWWLGTSLETGREVVIRDIRRILSVADKEPT